MLIVNSLRERMVFFMNPITFSELTLFAQELQRFLSPLVKFIFFNKSLSCFSVLIELNHLFFKFSEVNVRRSLFVILSAPYLNKLSVAVLKYLSR